MSDADSPKHDPGSISPDRDAIPPDSAQQDSSDVPPFDARLSLSGAPSASDASVDPLLVDVDGWQTVDFPGALRVDEIPCGEGDIPIMAVTSYAGLMQQLQQENTQMRDRITHLEDALALSQLSARTEILHQGDTHTNQSDTVEGSEQSADADLVAASGQRHQILVDTLNAQLQSSQERIAQLEQECTLVQQRLNEQIQQCLQAETTCRDLRTRLHRQQQQALQFKTALEKCLEVPTQAASPADVAPEPEPVFPVATPDGAIPLFVSKTSPVRPWSSQDDHAVVDGSGADTDLPKLSKLMVQEQPEVHTASSASLPAELLDLDFVNRVFPSRVAHESSAESIDADDAHIFDIRPFLDAAPESGTTPATAESSAAPPALHASASDDGNAYGDQPVQMVPSATAPERTALEAVLAIAQNNAHPTDDLTAPAELSGILAEAPPQVPSAAIEAPASAAMELASVENHSPFVSPALEDGKPDVDATADSSQPALFDAAGPSPLLYPLRPAKKLKSLAAVELPTFPRC